jgi:hypothetical protein
VIIVLPYTVRKADIAKNVADSGLMVNKARDEGLLIIKYAMFMRITIKSVNVFEYDTINPQV